ncbi:MAG: putative DNA binding domain-containing protein [Campylobacterota bacterium]|nr:putative DNA binding domain-containing protein [Campylobacterota bacterium]
MSNIIQQIQNGENKSLEFKETLPKNESIAKTVIAFSNTSGGKLIVGVNEQWGSGINRIKRQCLEAGLKEPQIVEKNDFVDVKFYRPQDINDRLEQISVGKPSETDDYGRLASENRRIPSDTTQQEKIVLIYIFEHTTIKSKQVEKLLNIKESRTRELLKQMVDKSLIVKLGSGRSTYYEVAGDLENKNDER